MIRAEPILRNVILTVARDYAKAHRLPLDRVSRAAYGDGRFLGLLAKKKCSFTVEKFDKVMAWFADPKNWATGIATTVVDECLEDAFYGEKPGSKA